MWISTGIVKPCFISLTILTLKTHLALTIQAEHFCRSENTDFFGITGCEELFFLNLMFVRIVTKKLTHNSPNQTLSRYLSWFELLLMTCLLFVLM